jgi:hypothetical protein
MRYPQINSALRTELLENGFGTVFDGGALELRDGVRPASPATAATGTILASITTPTAAFSTAASGTKDMTGTWEDASANASGDATWFRLNNVGDTYRLDGNVGRQNDLKTSGTLTSGTTTTASDSAASWSINGYQGMFLDITGGTGSGQSLLIKGNTANIITLETAWSTAPDNTSTYEVIERYDLDMETITIVLADTVSIQTFSLNLSRVS